ncbi:hypothetical protein P3T27_006531 [Kitasatospora sp. MAA19]|uniref:hypothetical protein n=1 Tax=Kitasatospora sp. MAA19 TaxID=3035090 RepID=UPI00247690B0|nr:hypothetical protein [Kitasatospora sp. MAA19]MDH6709782.1 hypothetical protein [Kitasatospora sp. MAA19]
MRACHVDTPDYWTRCLCQWTRTGQCATGRHTACRGPIPTHPEPETYLCGTSGTPLAGNVPVWLADRSCYWASCVCDCHTGAVPESANQANASDMQLSLL